MPAVGGKKQGVQKHVHQQKAPIPPGLVNLQCSYKPAVEHGCVIYCY
jgi:hypothetical protein